jgi:hypothetical protein
MPMQICSVEVSHDPHFSVSVRSTCRGCGDPRERARRAVHQLAIRECALAKEVFGNECRLESVNVNINAVRQAGSGTSEGHNVNSNFVLHLTRSQ